MDHLDAPEPPTPPHAPEMLGKSPDCGLIIDPVSILRRLMRMLAAIVALAIVAQLMLLGIDLLNHR